MRKAFSLLEVIFVIAIIAFLASVAVPKLLNSLNKADMVKIKGDIALIREGLNSFKSRMVLSNESLYLYSLEDNDDLLFSKILKYPILSAKEPKSGTWHKISNEEYIVWIDNETKVKFIYDHSNFTFDCDFSDENCKKLNSSY